MPQIWKAGKYETCTYVESKPWGTSKGALKVHCARLMPMIPMGSPKSTPVRLDKSIFINAADCNLGISPRVETQNYITAKAPTGEFKEPHYDFGTEIQIESLDDFLQSGRIVTHVDNSTNHYR